MPSVLFIRAAQEFTPGIIAHLEGLSQRLGFEVFVHDYKDLDSFEASLCCGYEFDAAILAAHGEVDGSGFGEKVGVSTPWSELGAALCAIRALVPNESRVHLACCHGARESVSTALFSQCDEIGSACGHEGSVTLRDAIIGIENFLCEMAGELGCETAPADSEIHCFYQDDFVGPGESVGVCLIGGECFVCSEQQCAEFDGAWCESAADCQDEYELVHCE